MSYRKEWTDWHLTARGWERGSERVDFGRITQVAPPPDRVLTYCWTEEQTSPYSRMGGTLRKEWGSDDHGAVEALLQKFGEPSRSL